MALTETVALRDGLRDILEQALGPGLVVGEPRRLTGGASRQVWTVEVTDAGGHACPVVLRRDPPGHGDAARMRAEAACLRAAAEVGVPVPAVLASGDTAPGIEAPYLVMNRVAGEALPRRIQRDDAFESVRSRLAAEMGHVLGLIHRTPLDSLTALDDTDPLETIEAVYRELRDPRPAVEIGLRWLRENRPRPRARALVHGDFRLGNLLIDGTGVRAVLDWELAHLGDPLEDLGWLCVRAWRFGGAPPVAGIGTREHLLDGYERATGTRPTSAELHWWECFGTLRWLVLSRFQAERHLGGAEHSLELAAIGRRVCESEYDLLTVLGLFDHTVGAPVAAPARPSVHDRPALTEIIDLVVETLGTDITSALDGPERERQRYLARICANLLRTAGRELAVAESAETLVRAELDTLGCRDEAELARRLREGTLSHRDDAVSRAVSTAVLARVSVASPRHLAR